ncbi:tyrosine-type recombinase/integrase [Streptomyces rochei]|uniref:tyrosine-type recombinase/integrase n=1 Tax=Streptomyces rochei TaxID=1928 RepID=UPI0034666DC3
MDLYFVRPRLVDHLPAEMGPGPVAVRQLLEHRAIPDGTPVFLDEQMRPVDPISSWFRRLAVERRDPETLRCYAYITRRLCAFLAERGSDLLSVTEADLLAYRAVRTELQDVPVDNETWRREASVLNSLFTWLVEEGHLRRRPFRMHNQSNPLNLGIKHEMKIRHLALDQYLYFRDVGMGGQLPDGGVDVTFRGWAPHRHRAAVELALLTGMRKQEWSTLLLPELTEGIRRPGDPVEVMLQACAKYKKRRVVYVPPAALEMVETYLLMERSEVAAKAAKTLARRHKDLFVVTDVDTAHGKLSGVLEGRRRTFAIAAMPPRLRRLAVRESDGGLEPLAVFIGHGGRMLGPSSWDRVREDAWRRMAERSRASTAPVLPNRPWRFHDLRHTFCLQLLKYLMRLVADREAASPPTGLPTLGEHIAFNPLLVVQRRMGHSSPATTYLYLRYLEDPMNYVDAAFAQWTEHDGATYAEIARGALAEEGHSSAS